MSVIHKFVGKSPFSLIVKHTKKVHECVELVRPLTEAMFAGDREKIEALHHEMSGREHEADKLACHEVFRLARPIRPVNGNGPLPDLFSRLN